MKSLKAMGKSKTRNTAILAEQAEAAAAKAAVESSRKGPRPAVIKMAMQDRVIDLIKSGNIEGLKMLVTTPPPPPDAEAEEEGAKGRTGKGTGNSGTGNGNSGNSDNTSNGNSGGSGNGKDNSGNESGGKDFINFFHTKSGMHPLAVAADESNVEALDILIAAGAKVNLVDQKGHPALFYAAIQSFPRVVEVLLDAGADVTYRHEVTGENAGHLAAKHRLTDIVQLLVTRGLPVDVEDRRLETVLTISLKLGNYPLCEYLLTNCEVRIDVVDGEGNTALLRCAYHGQLTTLLFILDHEGDLLHQNHNQETALHLACCHGHLDLVQELIKRGGKVNACDASGRTPLMVALMARRFAIVDYLLTMVEVDVNVVDIWGYTALFFACLSQTMGKNETGSGTVTAPPIIAIIRTLLSRPELKIDHQDRAFNTALIHAARTAQLEIVGLLLDHGADPWIANLEQQTAQDVLPENLRPGYRSEIERRGLVGNGRKKVAGQPHWISELQRHQTSSEAKNNKNKI